MNQLRPLLLAALLVPLTSHEGWRELKFNHLPPNHVEFSQTGLKIDVDKSASPLVYAWPTAHSFIGFKAQLEIDGELPIEKSPFPADAYLRLGLVVVGSRQISWMEKRMAASWITELFALAPKGLGLDRIQFFSLTANPADPTQEQEIPRSKGLMREVRILQRKASDKLILFSNQWRLPIKTVALWLASDGDDTRSHFQIKVHNLELTESPSSPNHE